MVEVQKFNKLLKNFNQEIMVLGFKSNNGTRVQNLHLIDLNEDRTAPRYG